MSPKLFGNNTICVWLWQNVKFLAENTSFWDQKQEEFGGRRRFNISRKSTTANGLSCVETLPSGFFTILAICHDRQNQSQSRVSEWFLQSGKFGQYLEIAYEEQK